MPDTTEQFSVYLTEGERVALRLLARHLALSESGVLRVLLRERAGLPIRDNYRYHLETFRLPHESRV